MAFTGEPPTDATRHQWGHEGGRECRSLKTSSSIAKRFLDMDMQDLPIGYIYRRKSCESTRGLVGWSRTLLRAIARRSTDIATRLTALRGVPALLQDSGQGRGNLATVLLFYYADSDLPFYM